MGFWSELVGLPIKVEDSKSGAWDDQAKEALAKAYKPSGPTPDTTKIAPTAAITQHPLHRSLSEASLGSSLHKPLQKEGIFQGKTFALGPFDDKKVLPP